MNSLQILTGLFAMQQQQQLQMPQQQQHQQQQFPQQMAINPLLNQMLQNFRLPPPMPLSPIPSMNNERKMTPKVNKETAAPLQKWFDTNIQNPYPTEEDKRILKNLTGFTDTQIGDWFRNKRRNYKKNFNGNIPWEVPTTTTRKRQNDSNFFSNSPNSVSTSPPEKRAKF